MTRMRRPSWREAVLTAAVLGAVANLPVLRSAWLHFGATEAELDAELPGDDVVEQAHLVATRAVTIAAEPDQVWPWVAQIGADRGGFYSYDALENLAGCQVQSAQTVEEQWQAVAVGDRVSLHPKVWLEVAEATPGRSLVLRSPARGGAPYRFGWAFVLRRAPHHSTRLIIRERYAYRSGWSGLVAEPTTFVSFVMTERMMRGIRSRAESALR